jgi:dCMP deaminase
MSEVDLSISALVLDILLYQLILVIIFNRTHVKSFLIHILELYNMTMIDTFNKPTWDEWFMSLAFVVSRRSIDTSTKHGTVVVGEDHEILSVGYNSPPRGCYDPSIPTERPDKYPYFIHSEENSILNAARTGTSLKGSTFYVTGHPCHRCFRGMVNVGAKEVVYGPTNSGCVTDEDLEVIDNMMNGAMHYGEKSKIKIVLREFYKINEVCDLLSVASEVVDSLKSEVIQESDT